MEVMREVVRPLLNRVQKFCRISCDLFLKNMERALCVWLEDLDTDIVVSW